MKRLPLLCVVAAAMLAALVGYFSPGISAAGDAVVPVTERPLEPQDTPAKVTLPPGFHATLFAGEPDIVQPMGMTLDDRGRLWVVENYSYPGWKSEGKDRVLIFTDKDGDGHFDERKVFLDDGVNVTSVAVGFGGVFMLSLPQLVFIPDKNQDDVPDGPAEVLLDGWDLAKMGHNAPNNLTWGVDGWLYGLNGIQAKCNIGKPGAADNERVYFDCGVWRYHPQRRIFETVSLGTTNPWGIDFDRYGQIFITNCVIAHLWHAMPGGHMVRMYGQDPNPNTYAPLQSCADHLHWAGGHWTESRGNKPEHNVAGGGHAHVGCMVYQGDNWPQEYRGDVFMINLHGNRVNRDILERHGSGYVAHHGPDFLTVGDSWFRGLSLLYGPDGGVYISDWTDTGECHDHKPEETDQTNGRIYKVTYGQPKVSRGNGQAFDLSKLSDKELVGLLDHKNSWYSRHASRLLQERHGAGKLDKAVRPALEQLLPRLHGSQEAEPALLAAWLLHRTGGLSDKSIDSLLASSHEYIRGWAIELELEDHLASPKRLAEFAKMARNDSSPVVRRFLASGLQRLPAEQRWSIAEALFSHAEDSDDANLPLMYWYGVEKLPAHDAPRSLTLAAASRIPLVRKYLVRRTALLDAPGAVASLDAVLRDLVDLPDSARQLDFLAGVQEALGGRRSSPMPTSWKVIYGKLSNSEDKSIPHIAHRLAVLFGDPEVIAATRQTVAGIGLPAAARNEAIDMLTQIKDPQLPELLFQVLGQRDVAAAAIRALATYDNPATPARILEHYGEFSDDERRDAVSTLASRLSYAHELFAAIEAGKIPRSDLAAYHVQQLQALKDKEINSQLNKVWGSVRPTAADKAAMLAKYRVELTTAALANSRAGRGRDVFAKNCANCHTLFGTGGKVGPDLTGSQRSNLDYVLSNVLDPSAVVAGDYQVTLVQTSDGRVVTGIVKSEDDQTLTLQTATDLVTLPKAEIDNRKKTATSMMPEGLFGKLTIEQVRDLVVYLSSREQVPLESP